MRFPPAPPSIAADSGLERAREWGFDVTIAVGDFDSASVEAVSAAEASGTRIERHPGREGRHRPRARARRGSWSSTRSESWCSPSSATGSTTSSRSFQLLAASRYAGVELDADIGRAQVHVDPRRAGPVRAAGRAAVAVRAARAGRRRAHRRTRLSARRGETLEPGSTRGVSNVFVEETATIAVEHGVVLAVRPGLETEMPM